MKKLLLSTLATILITGCAMCVNSNSLDIMTLFSSKSYAPNKAWVGTFQLVFNDMKNNIVKHDIKFVKERPTKELNILNNEEFNSDMLNEASYYTSYGVTSPKAKEEVKEAIMQKFNENSDIIDGLDWSEGPGKYYAYAMLKKEFEFINEFDKLGKFSFNNSDKKYEFFGIKNSSDEILDKNLNVLFYNNKNDYAVQILTANNDIVYLYRTNRNSTFESLFDRMQKQSDKYQGNRTFSSNDTLRIPNLVIDSQRKYPQLTNRVIEGTNIYFSEAIETLKLELNNKGGKVKSEAALTTRMTALRPEGTMLPRHFDFDKTFVMFLVDAGKENPYLALRIKDLENIGQ